MNHWMSGRGVTVSDAPKKWRGWTDYSCIRVVICSQVLIEASHVISTMVVASTFADLYPTIGPSAPVTMDTS